MKLATLTLLGFSFFLFFFQLNNTFLTSWDEAWYAVMARNMARSEDFITPIYNGRVWFATGPLYLWIVAGWFQLTNYSVYGVRLFSALAGFGTVGLTFLIGTRLKSKTVGFLAALILTTSIQFLFRSRQGNLDAPLAFFNTLAVYCFVKGRENNRWYLGIGVSVALGFLTKSILGLFPLLLLLFIPRLWMIITLAVFSILVTPWHLFAYQAHGMSFVRHYFFQYVLTKATNTNNISGADFLWYLSVLKHGLKVWILLVPLAIMAAINSFISQLRQKTPDLALLLFSLWVLLPFGVLTLAQMKNNWYVLSIYPGIALLIAWTVNLLFEKKIITGWVRSLTLLLFVLAGLINVSMYKSSFIVPETVAAEVRLAQRAKAESEPGVMILFDDIYLPVALYYADRPMYPLRYSRAFESLVSDESLREATKSGANLVLTNDETKDQLLERFGHISYQILDSVGDKLLIRLDF